MEGLCSGGWVGVGMVLFKFVACVWVGVFFLSFVWWWGRWVGRGCFLISFFIVLI